MSQETPSSTKLCPTCGTRVAIDSTRCLVCGAELGTPQKQPQPEKAVQSSRIPEVTLSLPIAILLLAIFLAIGAGLVYVALRSQPEVIIPPTITNTMTITVTPSITATEAPPTSTFTPEPSPTPITYQVRENDTCISIAFFFGVSVQSIVTLNNLPAACDTLYIGQPLQVPHPTPTPTPLPTVTLSAAEQTEAACEKVVYTVQENDTLSTIASAYGVPMAAIQDYNGLIGDRVQLGQSLTIPLCRRFATPGPSPTPTQPPPYPAPNLLLPPDGAPFNNTNDNISLQWASVGTLRSNEAYVVVVEDVTLADGSKTTEYVTDTKYIVPIELRPRESIPHIFRWTVGVARQIGTDSEGRPVWETAGIVSVPRTFTWSGGGVAPTPTP
jgi:LysM repeat protein